MNNRRRGVQLEAALNQYELVANRNATKLRLSIPAKEVWRYFVETARYDNNINFHSYFDLRALKQPQHQAHLRGSLYDIAGTDFVTDKWHKFIKFFSLNDVTAKKICVQDIRRYNKGWFLLELSEPGYLQALYRAFDHIFERDEELTLAAIKRIHRTATNKVRNTNYEKQEWELASTPGHVRNAPMMTFPLTKANITLAGIYQVLTNKNGSIGFRLNESAINSNTLSIITDPRDEESAYLACLAKNVPEFFKTVCKNPDVDTMASLLFKEAMNDNLRFQSECAETENIVAKLEAELELLIASFNHKIKNAADALQKLNIIVELIQSLEQLHPFADGNCRTFCMILLNQLLVRHGMPLSLTHDANCFDAFSHDEIVDAVLEGMEYTFQLIDDPRAFGSSTDTLLALADESNTIGANSRYFHQAVAIEERVRRRLKPYLEKRPLDEDLVQRPVHKARNGS